ncbi:elongation factor P 5-aminopentanone reductase [Oceanobacillus manasiensis]|uniref:elongation factor P 5-aminopentanone reductase n=1 Tax=Oceanobacillus manasiensis TaxID=586413 RepID=UPI0005A88CC5|nr:SDR family oxidoreductase [Oceanobacillus manasiensis]
MGKKVLIIGASGDIGIAIAEKLALSGYTLLLHGHQNVSRLHQFRMQHKPEVVLDVLEANFAIPSAIQEFMNKLAYSVDSVIFAGGRSYHGVFQQTPDKVMDEMLTLHVKAPWQLTKRLLPEMIQNNDGNIIFITSIWGEEGASNEVVYSSVKGAQNSFVRALAKEVGSAGVSVNGISPGFIETKMNGQLDLDEKEAIMDEIPLRRAGRPEEIANLVAFLLEKQSSYIHGEIINMTGGW